VARGEKTPSLDVGDVNDEDSHRENRGHPDESRIRALIHDFLHIQIMCQNPHRSLNIPGHDHTPINFRCRYAARA